ncbi:hypothetical protein GCM10010129_01050 [Streptomyces fumigatiscleroticus]|nr:hypothetical protein GCM10010129_01050 [Streptomyces fumigatiscleroticus]
MAVLVLAGAREDVGTLLPDAAVTGAAVAGVLVVSALTAAQMRRSVPRAGQKGARSAAAAGPAPGAAARRSDGMGSRGDPRR